MTKRVIRQRIWQGDKADARAVGENLRDVQSAVDSAPSFRLVSLENYMYTDGGIAFAHPTNPQAVLNICNLDFAGMAFASSVMPTSLKYNSNTVSVNYSGMTNGVRYALVRLLVIG